MARVTIIGYGNPLRGDDGLGWLVAQHLKDFWDAAHDNEVGEAAEGSDGALNAKRFPLPTNCETDAREKIEIIATHQLLPELAEEVGNSKVVLFVDACCDRLPGQISCRKVVERSNVTRTTTHEVDPSDLLQYADAMYGSQPEIALLITVGGESFGYEEGLSSTVSSVLPKVLSLISNITRRWMDDLPASEIFLES